jgi:hypothetical protein
MCNGSLHYSLKGDGNGYGISWIGDLSKAQNPLRMLFVDIQCFIMHITSQLFEHKHLSVISTILELQFTNHSWESCLEFLQRNGTLTWVELFNSPRRTIDLHGIYGCRGHDLQWNIWWWCESYCDSKHTPLINPSKWTLMYHWCSVTWIWIPDENYIRWH